MVPLSVQAGCQDFRAETGATAPIPSWAPVSGPGDDILTVYQPSSHSVWELWQAHRVTAPSATAHAGRRVTGDGWSACWAGKAPPEHVLRASSHHPSAKPPPGYPTWPPRSPKPMCVPALSSTPSGSRLSTAPPSSTRPTGGTQPRPGDSGRRPVVPLCPRASIAPTTTPPRSRTRWRRRPTEGLRRRRPRRIRRDRGRLRQRDLDRRGQPRPGRHLAAHCERRVLHFRRRRRSPGTVAKDQFGHLRTGVPGHRRPSLERAPGHRPSRSTRPLPHVLAQEL